MMYFHYQCAQCYCTLYRPNVPEGAECTSVVNGTLCSSCQAENDTEEEAYWWDD